MTTGLHIADLLWAANNKKSTYNLWTCYHAPNHEQWMYQLGKMVTNLFFFFLVYLSTENHPKLIVVAAGYRKALVDTGLAISLLFHTNGRRNCSSACRGSFFGTADNFQGSVHWLENPDHWKLANEWVWQRSWTSRGLMEKPLSQGSSASSKQTEWRYGSYGYQ